MDQHILELVFSYTSTGKDYKNYCLVSKAWYAVISKLFPGGDKFCNHLTTLLMKLPNGSLVGDSPSNESSSKCWDYTALSCRYAIPLEYIKMNVDKPWNYHDMSYREDLTGEFVEELHDKPWCYNTIVMRKGIGWNFIVKHLDKVRGDYVSRNKNITWDIVCNNPGFNWDYSELSYNNNIPWSIIETNIDKPWSFIRLSHRKDLSLNIIRKYPNKHWHYGHISIYGNIAWDDIKNNPNIDWKYKSIISYNDSITWKNILEVPCQDSVKTFCKNNSNIMKDIENYEHLVDYDALSTNCVLTEEYILVHPDKPWNYSEIQSVRRSISWKLLKAIPENYRYYELLSSKINITLKQFRKLVNKPWDYDHLSKIITWDFILEFPDKPWNYEVLTSNKKIPLDIIFNNPDRPWNIDRLSSRSDLTWQDVFNNPEIPWNVNKLSSRDDLTWRIVVDHPEISWNFAEISYNYFSG